LMHFLDSLGIPIVAVLRDSQNFILAAENGIGICELPPHKMRKDLEEIEKIVEWLNGWKDRRYDPTATGIFEPPTNVTAFRKPGTGIA
jgi:hypothetical protein